MGRSFFEGRSCLEGRSYLEGRSCFEGGSYVREKAESESAEQREGKEIKSRS